MVCPFQSCCNVWKEIISDILLISFVEAAKPAEMIFKILNLRFYIPENKKKQMWLNKSLDNIYICDSRLEASKHDRNWEELQNQMCEDKFLLLCRKLAN